MKIFGYCSVAVYKEGNKWNLIYHLEESYRGKNPTKDDITKVMFLLMSLNKK